jgi:hypothetical protein
MIILKITEALLSWTSRREANDSRQNIVLYSVQIKNNGNPNFFFNYASDPEPSHFCPLSWEKTETRDYKPETACVPP